MGATPWHGWRRKHQAKTKTQSIFEHVGYLVTIKGGSFVDYIDSAKPWLQATMTYDPCNYEITKVYRKVETQ